MTVLALSRRLPIPAPVTPTMCLIVDKDGFEARAGSWIEYHRGHLVIDRQQRPGALDDKARARDNETRAELDRLAARALRASEQGLVHLVQRRHGPEDFSYLAIKTRAPVKRPRIPYPPLKLSETR